LEWDKHQIESTHLEKGEKSFMNLRLEKFVMQDRIKAISKQLLDSQNEIIATNTLREINSIGELHKIGIFLKCQKKNIGNNFTAIAIFISIIALVLPAIETLFISLPYIFISLSVALALGLGMSIFNDGVLFINKTNEHNSKIEYLLWLIDEEVYQREQENNNKQTIKMKR
jgi:hypothetical protein